MLREADGPRTRKMSWVKARRLYQIRPPLHALRARTRIRTWDNRHVETVLYRLSYTDLNHGPGVYAGLTSDTPPCQNHRRSGGQIRTDDFRLMRTASTTGLLYPATGFLRAPPGSRTRIAGIRSPGCESVTKGLFHCTCRQGESNPTSVRIKSTEPGHQAPPACELRTPSRIRTDGLSVKSAQL